MYAKDSYDKGKGLFWNINMWVVLIKYVKHLTFVLGYRVSQKELNLLLRFPEGLELFAGLHIRPQAKTNLDFEMWCI